MRVQVQRRLDGKPPILVHFDRIPAKGETVVLDGRVHEVARVEWNVAGDPVQPPPTGPTPGDELDERVAQAVVLLNRGLRA